MEKINYHNKLLELIKKLNGKKPKLLLHSCCGPCSTQVVDFLRHYFQITIYYYNPNIEPIEEYLKRKSEQIRFIKEINAKKLGFKIDYLDCDYENEVFEDNIKGLEYEPEGSKRCFKCFEIRLKKTAIKALEEGFEYFGTTLSVSPYKNTQKINEIGGYIANLVGITFINGDFKKNDGYKKSLEFSKEFNLYRQDYCGCLYGKKR